MYSAVVISSRTRRVSRWACRRRIATDRSVCWLLAGIFPLVSRRRCEEEDVESEDGAGPLRGAGLVGGGAAAVGAGSRGGGEREDPGKGWSTRLTPRVGRLGEI